MAGSTSAQSRATPEKTPGRFSQVRQVLAMTVKYDRAAIWILLAAFLVPIVVAIVLCAIFWRANVFMWVLMVITGLLSGFLLFMLALNWRAERMAYSRLEGHTGAAGQVLSSTMRGQWTVSDMPVAFNARTQDCVYRAVGKPGIVFVTEGNRGSVKKLLDDERRKTQRVAPNVPIHHVHVGTGENDVPLLKLRKTLNGFEKTLTRAEISAVSNRLASLRTASMPIPKGIDPQRMRPSRKGLR